MRIFITGAGGFIGSALTRRLLQGGHEVVGLARGDEAATRLDRLGARPLRGDLADQDLLAQAARGADGVVHLGFGGPDPVSTDRANVHTFLDALAGSSRPFVYTSGATVVGDTGPGVLDETAPLVPGLPVSWRGETERLARDGAGRGVRAVAIRPSMVYGAGRPGMADVFLQGARTSGVARYVGSGTQRWSTVQVDDLADLYARALEAGAAGEVFNGASSEVVQFRALAELASRAAGAQGRTAPWPSNEARPVLGLLADLMSLNAVVSGEKARRVLGWAPRGTPLAESFARGEYDARQPA